MPESKWLAESSVDHLRLVLGIGNIGIWELDLASGKAWRNLRHDQIFGHETELPGWTYDQFLAYVVPEDRKRVDRLQSSAIERGEDWVFECRITREDGAERWISAAGRPLLDESGKAFKLIGHVIDITDTKRNETRLKVITAELNHRVRNMLAMIRAMISLSSRQTTDVKEFARSLEGRVGALSRTHDLLVIGNNRAFDPLEIVEREIAAFEEYEDRLTIGVEGRPVLRGEKAEGFSLVVHELITNAIKYGALRVHSGRIEIRLVEHDDRMEFVWKESGGPPVDREITPGFGTRMISSVLGDAGKVELDFRHEGLECSVQITR